MNYKFITTVYSDTENLISYLSFTFSLTVIRSLVFVNCGPESNSSYTATLIKLENRLKASFQREGFETLRRDKT